jgi:hypothetical protein
VGVAEPRASDRSDDPATRDALRRAYDDGRAAARRGEEAAPGCTTTPEGRAFLRGYVDGGRDRGASGAAPPPSPRTTG